MQLLTEGVSTRPSVSVSVQRNTWCTRLSTGEGQHALARRLATTIARTNDVESAVSGLVSVTAGACCDWCLAVVEPSDGEPFREVAAAGHVHLQPQPEHGPHLISRESARALRGLGHRPRLMRGSDADAIAVIARRDDGLAMLAELPARSAIVVPIPAAAAPAVLVLVSTSEHRPFRTRHLLFFQEVAQDFAAVLDRLSRIRDLWVELGRRDSLFEGIAHDLRGPLNVVLLAADGISAGTVPPDKLPRHLEAIRSSALYMNELITGLLATTRGTGSAHDLPLRAGDIVRRLVDSQLPFASSRQVTLTVSGDETVARPAAATQAVARVLWNLIDNAVRASPPRSVVTVSFRRVAEFVEFAVTNSGPGLHADDLEAAFRPYWSRRTREGGLGIGLGIAKQIVQDNGGSIWVRSSAAGPTTFGFRLPLDTDSGEEGDGAAA